MFADVYSYENELLYTGRAEKATEVANNSLKIGLSIEQITEITGLSLEEVMELKEQMQ